MGAFRTDRNYYQHQTSPSKLRGQYYTPEALVSLMLDRINLAPAHMVVDPACGDGSFLKGAVAAIALKFQGADRQALGKYWADRLLGFDIDAGAIVEARTGLRAAFHQYFGWDAPKESLRIHQANVFEYPRFSGLLKSVGIPSLRSNERLIVLGNPPYVEAKRLSREAKETLRALYPDAVVGAPDLYLYFLHICVGWLRARDTLAFVLPNKLLVNTNAQKIRERLLEEGRLRSLWFATQADVFPDAAVYPIVLFAGGRQRHNNHKTEISQITRTPAREMVQGESATVDTVWYSRTAARAFFPLPGHSSLRRALQTMLHQPEDARLGSVLDIRWTISFHRAGLREQYVVPHRPDDPSARRFVGGGPFSGNGEVTRYQLRWAGWWIRYDAAELQARKNPVPDIRLFERPKLVICQNGRTLRAAYDDQGYVLKDTFLCGSISDLDHPLCRQPRALVALLCSRAAHFFYGHVFYGGHVNGGYLHFLRSFLVDVPVGTWTEASASAAAALVRQRETAETTEQRERLEEQVEALVSQALELSEAEQAAIAAWASEDANWQARERVRDPQASRVPSS